MFQQKCQQRLLGVQAVLCLVEHDAVRTVDDTGGDLFTPVRRQAVHHDDVVGR